MVFGFLIPRRWVGPKERRRRGGPRSQKPAKGTWLPPAGETDYIKIGAQQLEKESVQRRPPNSGRNEVPRPFCRAHPISD